MNLRITDARGQCYDGASVMAGSKSGVASQFKALNPKCLYIHCYGHALNLSAGDSVNSVDCLKATLEMAREICKLIKKSPKRNTKLDEIRKANKKDSKGIHAFCPTRWTVCGEPIQSILSNYEELMDLWEWSLSNIKDTEMKARIRGVQAVMPTFDFLFGCELGIIILKQTDNLSRALQNNEISAAQGNALALDVVSTMAKDRSDASFDLFWERVSKRKEKLHVEDPKLPRKRKLPARLEEGNVESYYYPPTLRSHYQKIYFEALDCITRSITRRFDQPDFKKYINLQEILLKAIKQQPWEKELDEICTIYGDDFDHYSLEAQLPLLHPTAKALEYNPDKFTINDLIEMLKRLEPSRMLAMNEVVKLAKLLLVMPATNAVSERSFSALKRIKSY